MLHRYLPLAELRQYVSSTWAALRGPAQAFPPDRLERLARALDLNGTAANMPSLRERLRHDAAPPSTREYEARAARPPLPALPWASLPGGGPARVAADPAGGDWVHSPADRMIAYTADGVSISTTTDGKQAPLLIEQLRDMLADGFQLHLDPHGNHRLVRNDEAYAMRATASGTSIFHVGPHGERILDQAAGPHSLWPVAARDHAEQSRLDRVGQLAQELVANPDAAESIKTNDAALWSQITRDAALQATRTAGHAYLAALEQEHQARLALRVGLTPDNVNQLALAGTRADREAARFLTVPGASHVYPEVRAELRVRAQRWTALGSATQAAFEAAFDTTAAAAAPPAPQGSTPPPLHAPAAAAAAPTIPPVQPTATVVPFPGRPPLGQAVSPPPAQPTAVQAGAPATPRAAPPPTSSQAHGTPSPSAQLGQPGPVAAMAPGPAAAPTTAAAAPVATAPAAPPGSALEIDTSLAVLVQSSQRFLGAANALRELDALTRRPARTAALTPTQRLLVNAGLANATTTDGTTLVTASPQLPKELPFGDVVAWQSIKPLSDGESRLRTLQGQALGGEPAANDALQRLWTSMQGGPAPTAGEPAAKRLLAAGLAAERPDGTIRPLIGRPEWDRQKGDNMMMTALGAATLTGASPDQLTQPEREAIAAKRRLVLAAESATARIVATTSRLAASLAQAT